MITITLGAVELEADEITVTERETYIDKSHHFIFPLLSFLVNRNCLTQFTTHNPKGDEDECNTICLEVESQFLTIYQINQTHERTDFQEPQGTGYIYEYEV